MSGGNLTNPVCHITSNIKNTYDKLVKAYAVHVCHQVCITHEMLYNSMDMILATVHDNSLVGLQVW